MKPDRTTFILVAIGLALSAVGQTLTILSHQVEGWVGVLPSAVTAFGATIWAFTAKSKTDGGKEA